MTGTFWMTIALVGVAAAAAGAAAPWAGALPSGACGDTPASQPFTQFGDTTSYTLVPEGTFESGRGWILGGGARIVSSNSPFFVNSAGDRRSLLLAPRGTATSRPICIALGLPSMRFFTRATPGGILKVDVIYHSAAKRRTITEFARFGAGPSWWPTPPLLFAVNTPLLVGSSGETVVQFRFTVLSGAWQIDDVYVDPFKRR